MNIITKYNKKEMDTNSFQILKRFASYLDIDTIQFALSQLSGIKLSYTIAYYKEMLKIIRERLSKIVIKVEDELGIDMSDMQQMLTLAEDLEEAVEAIEEYGDSDSEWPEQKEIEERTTEVKTTIDLILPPEIIEAAKEAVKEQAEEQKVETKTAVVETAKATEEQKETVKETVKEEAKQEAENTVAHAGAGQAFDDLIEGVRNGGNIDILDIVIGATGGQAAGTGLGLVAGAAAGAAPVGIAVGVGAATGAGVVVAGEMLAKEEAERVADALQHAKEVVEEAIKEGKSPSEAQMAGIEALQPTTPGQPDLTGLYIDEHVEGGREGVYTGLGDYANELYEEAKNDPTNGTSTDGTSTDGTSTDTPAAPGESGCSSDCDCCDSDSCDDSCCDNDCDCCVSDCDCCVADNPEPCSGDICVQD